MNIRVCAKARANPMGGLCEGRCNVQYSTSFTRITWYSTSTLDDLLYRMVHCGGTVLYGGIMYCVLYVPGTRVVDSLEAGTRLLEQQRWKILVGGSSEPYSQGRSREENEERPACLPACLRLCTVHVLPGTFLYCICT